MQVANTILQQLGGNRFRAMTGAKDFLGSEDSLMFSLPASLTKKRINKVRVTLTPADTYKLEFMHYNRRKLEINMVAAVDDVYVENLRSTFTHFTGLDTHL